MQDDTVKKVLNLGFIGGGLSSAVGQVHYNASRLDGRWNLYCGAFSRNAEVNQATSDKWHVDSSRVYSNWQEMVDAESDNLDAIAVLTPTPEHADIVAYLLDRNINVICEKALAIDLNEAYLLQKKLETSSSFLAVTYNYSGYPMVRELREIIKGGKLGKIQQIHFEMPQEGFVRPPDIAGKKAAPQSWRLNDTKVPMIAFDLGAHLNHLALFLTGNKPQRVFADFSNYSEYEGVTDNIMMLLDYEQGMKGTYWISKTTIGNRNGMKLRLYGSNGTAEWTQINPEELKISYIDGTNTTVDRGSSNLISGEQRYNRMKPGHPSGFIEAFSNLYDDIANALDAHRNKRAHENPYVYGIDHSLIDLQVFTAACVSNDKGVWVDLDDV